MLYFPLSPSLFLSLPLLFPNLSVSGSLLQHRRLSEASISPPGSSIGSPSRVICVSWTYRIASFGHLTHAGAQTSTLPRNDWCTARTRVFTLTPCTRGPLQPTVISNSQTLFTNGRLLKYYLITIGRTINHIHIFTSNNITREEILPSTKPGTIIS